MATPITPNMVSTPVVFRATAVIPAGAAGATVPVVFDSTKIQNTLRVPVEVTTIILTAHGTGRLVDGSSPLLGEFGPNVEVDLGVHRYRMTDGFVPFPVLAAWNDADDTLFSVGIEPGAVLNTGIHTERVSRVITLPQPIRLAPGVGFSGSVRRNPPSTVTAAAAGAQTVSMTLIGKTLPDGVHRPTVQRIPFWTSARIALRSPGRSLPLSAESTEYELRNPLAINLDVDRMITASILPLSAGLAYVATAAALNAIPAPQLQLRWPNGDLLNESGVEQAALFRRRYSYIHPFTLAPSSRVRATLRSAVAADLDFLLALFGTRPEVL